MNDKKLRELMSIICEGDDSEQRRKVEQYITDLQKENKQLQQQCKKQKEVIDKAIEYINENWGHWCSNHCKYATETINILKGSDKEEVN